MLEALNTHRSQLWSGRAVRLLGVAATALLLSTSACSPYGFKSFDEYRTADEAKRTAAVRTALQKSALDATDGTVVKYIDLALRADGAYALLDQQLKPGSMDAFLTEAVAVLYHAYSPANLKSANAERRAKAKAFIVDSWPCQFGEIEAPFRAYIAGRVDQGDNFVFRYLVDKDKKPDDVWSEKNLDFNTKLVNTVAWRDGDFSLRDFRRLKKEQQATLLRQNYWMNLALKDGINEKSVKLLDLLETLWSKRGDTLRHHEPFSSLTDSAKFGDVADAALEVMRKT